jgi:hypothetical protein
MPAVADNVADTVDRQVEIELTATQLIMRRLDTGAETVYNVAGVTGPFYISVGTLTGSASVQVFDLLKR